LDVGEETGGNQLKRAKISGGWGGVKEWEEIGEEEGPGEGRRGNCFGKTETAMLKTNVDRKECAFRKSAPRNG
jgi:hypothetical protein